MPRMKRQRRVWGLPPCGAFAPVSSGAVTGSAVEMTVEEYETLRLIDYEGLNQEACAAEMDVGRTTVQQIYCDARRKLSAALVEGRPLLIRGGEYCLRQEEGPIGGCRRRRGCGPGGHGPDRQE